MMAAGLRLRERSVADVALRLLLLRVFGADVAARGCYTGWAHRGGTWAQYK